MKSVAVIGIFLLALLAYAGHAVAGTSCEGDPWDAQTDKMASGRLALLIKEKNFAAVDAELNQKLKHYRNGEYSDVRLRRDLELVAEEGVVLAPLLAEWTRNYPESYFGFLLKGMNHTSIGFSMRGHALADKTSLDQFAAQRVESEKAVAALDRAIYLGQDIGLGYAALITEAKTFGGIETTERIWRQAVLRDPKSLAIVQATAVAFNPKWGGSFERLDRLVEQAQADHMPDAKLNLARFYVEMQKANSRFVETLKTDYKVGSTKEKSDAVHYWLKANEVCPSIGALWSAADIAVELEDWRSVETASTLFLSLALNDRVLVKRANALEKMGNFPGAFDDYLKANAHENILARKWLGDLRFVGDAAAKTAIDAKAQIDRDAEQGNVNAQRILGAIHNSGLGGVSRDYALAIKWYQLAALQGDPWAQFELGVAYYYGKGVPQDYVQGLKWFRQAAEKGGDWRAQLALGRIYSLDSRTIDFVESLKWFRLAAKQGILAAQEAVGYMYDHGKGVPVDDVKAVMWFSLSALRGGNAAAENKKLIEVHLTREQIAAAQDMASECLLSRLKVCD